MMGLKYVEHTLFQQKLAWGYWRQNKAIGVLGCIYGSLALISTVRLYMDYQEYAKNTRKEGFE